MKTIKDLNSEFNRMFNDKLFMPMIKFSGLLIFLAIILDFGFQMIEAIDILTMGQ